VISLPIKVKKAHDVVNIRLMFLSVCKTTSKAIQQLQVRNVSINLDYKLCSLQRNYHTPTEIPIQFPTAGIDTKQVIADRA